MLMFFTVFSFVFCWNDMSLPHNGAMSLKQIFRLSPVSAIYFMKRKSLLKTLTTKPISHHLPYVHISKQHVTCNVFLFFMF